MVPKIFPRLPAFGGGGSLPFLFFEPLIMPKMDFRAVTNSVPFLPSEPFWFGGRCWISREVVDSGAVAAWPVPGCIGNTLVSAANGSSALDVTDANGADGAGAESST